MTFEYLVSHYGYMALVVGTFFEGETILIAAGFAAHGGYLKLQWVILAAFLGSLAGDQFYFFVGRMKGKTFLHRRPAWETKVARVLQLFDQYRTLVVLGFRFMYGLRTVTPFAFGLSGISTSRFVILNLIGALVWSVVVAFVGYLFGAAARAVMVNVRQYEHWIILGILWTGALVYIIYFLHKRETDRMEGRP
ncbi:MAG TPA: DedA family protein [Syntrophorhabdales bacterium]|nr:DedA family protein [Syntrophorhabdales bacterium]